MSSSSGSANFDGLLFDFLRARYNRGDLGEMQNRLSSRVEPPRREDMVDSTDLGPRTRERLHARGLEAIAKGEVACIVLAGGMATRFGGGVKAAAEVLPGRSFFDLKLSSFEVTAKLAQTRLPVLFMSSFATDSTLRTLVQNAPQTSLDLDVFVQDIFLRVRPDGSVFEDASGQTSPYAAGHGDLPFVLRRSGKLHQLLNRGVKALFVSNVDNLGATLDPVLVGMFLERQSAMLVEVTAREKGDTGGMPARVDGIAQIVEHFRFPSDFDTNSIDVFNTNTMLIDARSLDRDFPLSWFVAKKKVDGQDVVQFERLVGELTAFVSSAFVLVSRHGAEGRFQPIKDQQDLIARRPEIEELLRARGVL